MNLNSDSVFGIISLPPSMWQNFCFLHILWVPGFLFTQLPITEYS